MKSLIFVCILAGLGVAHSLSYVPDPFPETCPEAKGIYTPCLVDVDLQHIECADNSDCEPDERCCSYGCGLRSRCFKKKTDKELPTCWQSADPGSCPSFQSRIPVLRWYYDKEGGRRCRRFKYSGCGGNKNNFRTYRECFMTCGNRYIPREEEPPIMRA